MFRLATGDLAGRLLSVLWRVVLGCSALHPRGAQVVLPPLVQPVTMLAAAFAASQPFVF